MLFLASALLTAAFLPPPICLVPHRGSACCAVMKMNKQQQLALLREQAERQRQGLPTEEVPQKTTSSAQKKKGSTAPRTREELASVMKKIQADNPDGMAAKTQSHLRYGISFRPQAAPAASKPAASRPAAAKPIPDAGYSYSEFQQLLKGDGKTESELFGTARERDSRSAS